MIRDETNLQKINLLFTHPLLFKSTYSYTKFNKFSSDTNILFKCVNIENQVNCNNSWSNRHDIIDSCCNLFCLSDSMVNSIALIINSWKYTTFLLNPIILTYSYNISSSLLLPQLLSSLLFLCFYKYCQH